MYIGIIVFIYICSLLTSMATFAVCPLCSFAMGAGIGLTQYFGIDDTITALWIGGFIVSLIIWTNNWLEKKNICFYGYKTIVVLSYYCIVIVPFYFKKIIGHELNRMWGIDKVLLGIAVGSIVFFIGAKGYDLLKKRNGGKAYFPFQKIVMPMSLLIILSIYFYYLTK